MGTRLGVRAPCGQRFGAMVKKINQESQLEILIARNIDNLFGWLRFP
jgi:hypothetical protein